MNDDTISRKAAIDAVTTWINLFAVNRSLYNSTSIQDILRQLPSAQRWIPCSERLPEDNGNYLVTYVYKDDKKGTEEPYVISDMFLPWKGAFATEEPTDKARAWMPLPEPYKERREE